MSYLYDRQARVGSKSSPTAARPARADAAHNRDAQQVGRWPGHNFGRIAVGGAPSVGSEVWYFGGEPGNDAHPTETTLTAPASGRGMFSWEVVTGARNVRLLAGGDGTSAVTGRANTVGLRGVHGSGGRMTCGSARPRPAPAAAYSEGRTTNSASAPPPACEALAR